MVNLNIDVKFVPQEQDKMDILRLPKALAQTKKIKIIVCIDEFQQLAHLPEYKKMEGKKLSAWQQQERVPYCLYFSLTSVVHCPMVLCN